MLVCRDWAVAAGNVLWRNVPAVIFDYVPADCRPHYAAKVRGLAEQQWLPWTHNLRLIWRRPPCSRSPPLTKFGGGLAALDELAFPQLHVLSLERLRRRYRRGMEQRPNDICRLIGPRLDGLSCTIDDLRKTPLLARLADVRPPLRELLVRHVGDGYDNRFLILPELPDYFTRVLKKLELQGGVMISASALMPLAHSKILKQLRLSDQRSYLTTDEVVAAAFKSPPRCSDDEEEPFEALEALEIRCSWNAVSLLARSALPALRQLRLMTCDEACAP